MRHAIFLVGTSSTILFDHKTLSKHGASDHFMIHADIWEGGGGELRSSGTQHNPSQAINPHPWLA